jgi:hypothetical protein
VYLYQNRTIGAPSENPRSGTDVPAPSSSAESVYLTTVADNLSTTVTVRASAAFREKLRGYDRVRLKIADLDIDTTVTAPFGEQLHRKVLQGNRTVTTKDVSIQVVGIESNGAESVVLDQKKR